MKYFIAVCENGSITAAFKSLFVTQPALSTVINQLEKSYNLRFLNGKTTV